MAAAAGTAGYPAAAAPGRLPCSAWLLAAAALTAGECKAGGPAGCRFPRGAALVAWADLDAAGGAARAAAAAAAMGGWVGPGGGRPRSAALGRAGPAAPPPAGPGPWEPLPGSYLAPRGSGGWGGGGVRAPGEPAGASLKNAGSDCRRRVTATEGDSASRVRLCRSRPSQFKTAPAPPPCSTSVGGARAGVVGAFPARPWEPPRSPSRAPAAGLAHAGQRGGVGTRSHVSFPGEGEGEEAGRAGVAAWLGPGGATGDRGVMRGQPARGSGACPFSLGRLL